MLEKPDVFPKEDSLMVGKSPSMMHVYTFIDRVKNSNAPIFIGGESGTGKELVAREIHQLSQRRKGPFVALNCGAIPDNLIESELFGYARGAFTGAVRDRPGLVEEASSGTLFLDEICDLSLHLQAKLLRLLEEKSIRRIGENRSRPVNVRFISATNKSIECEVKAGRFREDLFYRLKILSIELKPLRLRKDDIQLLIEHFIVKYCLAMQRRPVQINPAALELLLAYPWPGNVRELQNEIQKCLVLCQDAQEITPEDLSVKINPHAEKRSIASYGYFQAKADFEKRFLHQALSRCNYNRAKTAREIGISRQGLFKLIKKHGIPIPSKGKALVGQE